MGRVRKAAAAVTIAAGVLAGLAPFVSPAAAGAAGASGSDVTPVTTTTVQLGGAAAASTTDGGRAVDVPAGTDMVGFTWTGDPDGEIALRSRNADGTWTEWVDVHSETDEAPDLGTEGSPRAGGSVTPLWVGGTDRVEVRAGAALGDVEVHALEIGPPPAPQAMAADGSQPAIHLRSEWGAAGWAYGNSDCGAGPRYARPHYLIIHHTVNVNTYAAAEVASMLRGIQSFHLNTRG